MTAAKSGPPQPPIARSRPVFEGAGPGDDKKIGDSEQVELKDGMHFFSVPSKINPGTLRERRGGRERKDAGLLLETTSCGWMRRDTTGPSPRRPAADIS